MEVNVVVAPVKSGDSSALRLESSKHVRKFNERPPAHVLVNYPERAGSKKQKKASRIGNAEPETEVLQPKKEYIECNFVILPVFEVQNQ